MATTGNKSFIDVYDELRNHGVNDNPDLEGVDPYDPNLSYSQKRLIIQECIGNFWYFIREVVRWPLGDGTYVPTKLDKGNAAMYWCSLNGISSWRTNIRQTCSDLSVETFLLWILITKTRTESKVISGLPESFHYELAKILDKYSMLPESILTLLPPLTTRGGGRNGISYIKNKHICSEVNGLPRPRSLDAAKCALRGNAADVIFFHMAEFIPRLGDIIDTRIPVTSPNLNRKKRINIFNSPYGNPDDDSTILSQTYIEGMIKWKDTFYDHDSDQLLFALCEYGNGVMYIKHNYQELGYSEEWFEEMKKVMDKKNLMKEILLVRSAVGMSNDRKPNFFNEYYHKDLVKPFTIPGTEE